MENGGTESEVFKNKEKGRSPLYRIYLQLWLPETENATKLKTEETLRVVNQVFA